MNACCADVFDCVSDNFSPRCMHAGTGAREIIRCNIRSLPTYYPLVCARMTIRPTCFCPDERSMQAGRTRTQYHTKWSWVNFVRYTVGSTHRTFTKKLSHQVHTLSTGTWRDDDVNESVVGSHVAVVLHKLFCDCQLLQGMATNAMNSISGQQP